MPLGSWYSQLPAFGWFDPEDRPGSAAFQVGGRSIPDSQQGIALPTRGGLGKWYNVTQPGADRPMPFQQTDIGPAPWTGRGVDISAAAANQMGYTPKNFPTNANFKVEPIDLTGLGLAAGWNGGVPGDNQTAIASAAPARKSMPSLMDMFTPTDATGQQQSFGNALRGNSNSLIGLGLGLLQPRSLAVGAPAESAWSNALGGYMQGAQADAVNAYRQAQLAHTKRQEDFQRSQAAQAQANFERTFARGGEGDFSKVAREIGLTPGTPEYTAAANKYYQGKTEGDWTVAEAQHPLYPDQKVPMWVNKRTRETAPLTGGGAPPSTSVAGSPNAPLTGGGVSYGQGLVGPSGFGTGGTGPAYSGTTDSTASTGQPGRAFPPPPPGMNLSEYTKEKTKEYVKQQAGKESTAQSANVVTGNLDRAMNLVQNMPGRTTGLAGQLLSNIGGTEAANLAGLLNTVKANVSFDKLQQMRRESPTGGALGNVSDKEQKMLQATISDLEQSREPAQLLYNLGEVKRVYHDIINGPGTAPPNPFPLPAAQQPPGSTRTGGAGIPGAPRPGFVKGGYVFKGGNPSQQENWAPVK